MSVNVELRLVETAAAGVKLKPFHSMKIKMKRIFMKMFHQGELRNKKNIHKGAKSCSRFGSNTNMLSKSILTEKIPMQFKILRTET